MKAISRRVLLKSAALLTCVAGVCAQVLAAGKISRSAAEYQSTPKKRQRCVTCIAYIPPRGPGERGGCTVIDGPVESNGWCRYFVGRAR